MSREQANTYKKYREADDAMGNLGWASKMSRNAVRQAPEAPADIESVFGFGDREKLLWALVKIPRRYTDLETCGVLPAEAARGFFRGLVAADVLDMVAADEGKALVPMEIKRLKAKIKGKGSATKKPTQRKAIHERVFRPDIGLSGEGEAAADAPAPRASSSGGGAPKPVSMEGTPAKAEPLKAKDWDVKKKLAAAFDAMGNQDHYAFLNVDENASDADIKTAGLKLARDYHPDILSGSVLADDVELVGKLDALFKRLQEARSVLGDSDKRRAYNMSLDSGTTRSSGEKVRRPVEAKIAFQKAETFFKKKDYESAEQHYRTATELDFDEPAYQVSLAWCIFMNDKREKAKRTDKAYRKLTGVLDKHKTADAAYRLGVMARMDGDEKKALKRFKEAARLDPKHQAASQEVRIAERRANKAKDDAKKDGGMFGKFLKR
jgi:curved DNA-binding protein CbpA